MPDARCLMPDAGPIQSVRWAANQRAVQIIDQRRLPNEFVELDLTTLAEVREAIQTLAVRGAPAIGICGAMGRALSLAGHADESRDAFLARARDIASDIAATRTTAVNLAWALNRVLDRAGRTQGESMDMLEAMR